ncbi:MAG: DUF5688 family protein [Eubacteriales bacterium]|nr:DUF5688 family protein [Eubacteriales bacterium]
MFLDDLNHLMEKYEREITQARRLMEEMSQETGMDLSDYSMVRRRLAVLVFDAERESSRLRGVLYRDYENLAIEPVIYVEISDCQKTCIKVCSMWANFWQVSPDDLIDEAIRNAPNVMPPRFGSISSYIGNVIGVMIRDADDPDGCELGPDMYFLSNENNAYGASAVFYPHLMEAISVKLDADLFVLPSSVHETIIMPDSGEDPHFLLDIVTQINEEFIRGEDVLCSGVFYYRRSEGRLRKLC